MEGEGKAHAGPMGMPLGRTCTVAGLRLFQCCSKWPVHVVSHNMHGGLYLSGRACKRLCVLPVLALRSVLLPPCALQVLQLTSVHAGQPAHAR
jgi:hypothetical protein